MATMTVNPNKLLTDLAQLFARMTIGIYQSTEKCVAVGALPVWTVQQSFVSAIELPDWLSEISAEPNEVRRICNTPQAIESLQSVVGMARRHFVVGSRISARVEQDPESDAEWVLIDVA